MPDPHPWPDHTHGALETCIDCGGPMFLCRTLETGFHLPGWECQLFRSTIAHDRQANEPPVSPLEGRRRRIDAMSPDQLEMEVAAMREREAALAAARDAYVEIIPAARMRSAAGLMFLGGALVLSSMAWSTSWIYRGAAMLHGLVSIVWGLWFLRAVRHGDATPGVHPFDDTSPLPFILATIAVYVVLPLGFPQVRYGWSWIAGFVVLLIALVGLLRFVAVLVVERQPK
jgi:hypothetical protein